MLDPDVLFSGEEGPETCRICLTSCPTAYGAEGGIRIHCPRCGPYYVTGTAWAMLAHEENRSSWVQLSGWCRDQQLEGREPAIDSDTIRQSKDWLLPDFISRANRLLRWQVWALDWKPNTLDYMVLPSVSQNGVSYSRTYNEVLGLNRLLTELGYFRFTRTEHTTWYVTGRGRLRAEELERSAASSSTAFVAMWFNAEVQSAWEDGIRPAIADTGYDPIRVDQIEHVGRIDDEIMLQIKKSRFIVADFTGHRGGVYFEAGYALGLGLPVFWSCREDGVGDLHFDIRQYNSIVWSDVPDLRRRLRARIENVIGRGPRTAATA